MKNWKPFFYFVKTVYSLSLPAALYSLGLTVVKTAVPIITLLLSAQLLQELTAHVQPEALLKTIAVIILFNLISGLLQSVLSNRFHSLIERTKDDFSLHIGNKMMQMQYGKLESAYVQDLKQQALIPIVEWGTFEFVLNEFVPTVLSSILTILTTFFLVAEYSLLLMIPILLLVGVHLLLSIVKTKRFQSVMMRVGLIERKLGYYNTVTSDFSLGKDLRVFRIDRILMKKIRELNDKEVGEFSQLFYQAAFIDFWETIITQIQIYIVYFVAAFDLFQKAIGIGYYFQITGLFINFGNATFQLMNAFVNLKARNRFLEKFMEFDCILTDRSGQGVCSAVPQKIEFNQVSFTYEGAEQEVLSNISFTIPAGHTVMLVGENGSGKTTIAKLLSGFLTPSSGSILIGEEPLAGDARSSLSAVYQDFQLFAFTIRENVETAYSGQNNVDTVLDAVGMLTPVRQLQAGTETFLYKAYQENGIEFSHGQSQKIATARALYKDAGIIILDEPTSAYDAKAEYEIFKDFRQLTKGKTALLISHRLWSCQFCDEIFVIDDKKIVERGTHDQLMSINKGKYREMFLSQAQYYMEK